MTDLTLPGEACPGLPITHALPRAMMYPNASGDASAVHNELAVIAARGHQNYAADLIAKAAMREGQPALLAAFDEANPNRCCGLHLFVPKAGKLLAGLVDPCIPRPGAPMILVARDRTMAFAMHTDGKLVECAVPRRSQIQRGNTRAWNELVRRMRTTVTDTGLFMHTGVELHLPRMVVPEHS